MAGMMDIGRTGSAAAHIGKFRNSVVPVRRWTTDEAIARSRQQGDHCFHPVGRPDEDAVALDEPTFPQISRKGISRAGQVAPGKGLETVG